MTQEEKQLLLLKDLCARLQYGVKVTFRHNGFRWDWPQTLDEIKKCDDGDYAVNGWGIHGIKPYLRPMSSMTEEESREFATLQTDFYSDGWLYPIAAVNMVDWLNAHHFDYRGLIEKGLALEAPEGMYETE